MSDVFPLSPRHRHTKHLNLTFTVADTDWLASEIRALTLHRRWARVLQISRYRGWSIDKIVAVCAEMRISIPRESEGA